MSRSTQYIGLTAAAEAFVKDAKKEFVPDMTCGISGEPVPGSKFYMPDGVYEEREQLAPWSAGPMIFTCLLCITTGNVCFEWKEDKKLRGVAEYDKERGTFCV